MIPREGQAVPAKSRAKGFGKPAVLYESGLRHLRAGAHLDAQLCCQQALAMDPHHADTMHLMGLISLHANHHDLAVEWISRAITLEPKPEYLTSLGTTLLNQGRGEEALKTFDKAVQLRPDSAELWKNLGDALLKLERPDEALLSFQHALKLDPHNSEAAEKSASLVSELSGRK
jgi:cytochrome c-type biogenesis protein CcmH/NrfG